jgi:hypothetical protein
MFAQSLSDRQKTMKSIPFANIFEQQGDPTALWGLFQAQHLPRLRVIHDPSQHGCNGAYLCATDDPDAQAVSRYEFEAEVKALQKTYFGAWEMSRAAFGS